MCAIWTLNVCFISVFSLRIIITSIEKKTQLDRIHTHTQHNKTTKPLACIENEEYTQTHQASQPANILSNEAYSKQKQKKIDHKTHTQL